MTNYTIRKEPFIGNPPLPPYNNHGGNRNPNGADFTHAIYHDDQLEQDFQT